jgi:hypothetical protein
MTDDYFILGDKVIYKGKMVAGITASEFREAVGYVHNYNLYVKVGNVIVKNGEIVKDIKGDDIEDLSKNQWHKYVRRGNTLLYDGHVLKGIKITNSKDFEVIEPTGNWDYYAKI